MSVCCVIQARMASKRLPSKVMMEAAGKPLLQHVIERVQACPEIDEVIVATTNLPEDQVILDWCEAHKLKCLGWTRVMADGHNDVLARYWLAAQLTKAETFVRVTCDCPCWAPNLGSQVIRNSFIWESAICSNVQQTVDGFDTEVFTREMLLMADAGACSLDERQHVTRWMYRHAIGAGFCDHRPQVGGYKLSVDTEQDLRLVQYVLEHVENYSWQETIKWAKEYEHERKAMDRRAEAPSI